MIALLCLNLLLLVNLIQQTSTATAQFDDLGKFLLGGVVAAIVLAVGFTLVRFRLSDKKPQTSKFISISSEKD